MRAICIFTNSREKLHFLVGHMQTPQKITSCELYCERILLKTASCQVQGDLSQDVGGVLQETITDRSTVMLAVNASTWKDTSYFCWWLWARTSYVALTQIKRRLEFVKEPTEALVTNNCFCHCHLCINHLGSL